MPQAAPDPIPDLLPCGYRVERELGQGGMATVYLAADEKHGRQVAIKVLRPEIGAAIGAERFRREIEILARLNHPHIVTLHDSGATGDRLWYVMPYVVGESLRARLIREPKLPVDEAVRLAREIAGGLGHAHRQGVVHRDIKPENVLLSEGLAQISDFGIARENSVDGATRVATTAGVALGTLRYMAPEQITGGLVDARTDLYALACVLYEMLAGSPPFEGPADRLARQHLVEAPRPITALRPGTSPELAQFLARGLAKSPEDRFLTAAHFAEALLAAAAGSGTRTAATAGLPGSRHPFVGRERELVACRALLAETRLLTLIGVGGTGKSRLALRLAEEHAESGPVHWIDLAPIQDSERVTEAVAQAVGVRETAGRDLMDLLRDRLRAAGTWLVLDNCEHVRARAAELVDAILTGCEDVCVLATSREPLAVTRERTHALPPLAVPSEVTGIEQSDAGLFFLQRVRSVHAEFVLTDANAQTVLEICRRLDGIPLALDLAAARVRVLSLEQIRARLDDRFRLLKGGDRGAHTLRATVQWSYDQLAPSEQELFLALATFAGGWTLELASRLLPALDEFELIDALGHLLDKSLILVEHRGEELRYGMLETLRQFGRERALELGIAATLRARHADAMIELAERAVAEERLGFGDAWGERLEAYHDNLAWALEHLRTDDPERHLQLAGGLGWFWHLRSHYKEGAAHLTAALAATDPSPRPARARGLRGAALMLAWQGEAAAALRLMEESLAMLRALGDSAEVAHVLDSLGWVHFASGEDERARVAFEESLALEIALGDPRRIARARAGLGQALVALHRTDEARGLAQTIIAQAAAYGDRRNEHFGWHFLADCALIEGDCAASLPLYRRSLALAQDLGDRLEIGFELQGVAMSLAGLGESNAAVQLAAAVEAEFERIGADIQVRFWNALLRRYVSAARAGLDAQGAARATAEGRALNVEQAIALAGRLTPA